MNQYCTDDIGYGSAEELHLEQTSEHHYSLEDENYERTPNLYSDDLGSFDALSDDHPREDDSEYGDISTDGSDLINEPDIGMINQTITPPDGCDDFFDFEKKRPSRMIEEITPSPTACDSIDEDFEHKYKERTEVENDQQQERMPTPDSKQQNTGFLDTMDKVLGDSDFDRKQETKQTQQFLDKVNIIICDRLDDDQDYPFDRKQGMPASESNKDTEDARSPDKTYKIIDDSSFDRKQATEQTQEFLDTKDSIVSYQFDNDLDYPSDRKQGMSKDAGFPDTTDKVLDDSRYNRKQGTKKNQGLLDTKSTMASDLFDDDYWQPENGKLDDIEIGRTQTSDTVTVDEEDAETSGDLSPQRKEKSTGAKKKKKARCDMGSCLLLIVVIVCTLVAGIVGLAFFIFGVPNPLYFFQDSGDIGATFDDFNFDGTTVDMSTYKFDRWETKKQGKGLELYIENALDESWSPYLEEYEALFDQAEPDALSLKIWKVQADSECSPSFGRLKVCNGNYGKTNWEGINLSLVHEGYIKWSTSKMNDYFLVNESEEKKKYTMCHELGHGFGLSHSDEDYHNRNRGDCMDYTNRVEGNLLPGRYNHEILSRIYGTVPSERARELEEAVPDNIMNKYFETVKEIQSSEGCSGSSCIKDIGEGYTVKGDLLLVNRN